MEKISFCVTYYNQESFVEKSLSSIFSMDIPCDFEVIVGDDGSSDNTLSEVQKFIDLYPNKIKVFVQDRRETAKTINRASLNRLNIAKQATGDYIIFLDGDDYYCDKGFIKKALTILNNDKNLIACGANFKYIYPEGREEIFPQKLKEGKIKSFDYISKGHYTHSGAILFRNILTKETIKLLENINNFDDNAITIYMLQFGDMYYIDTPFYSYYQCPNSLWNQCNNIEKDILNAMDYKFLTLMAPKFKLEILKRQLAAIKCLYSNKNTLKNQLGNQFETYLDVAKKNKDMFIEKLLIWTSLNFIDKFMILIYWKYLKWLSKLNVKRTNNLNNERECMKNIFMNDKLLLTIYIGGIILGSVVAIIFNKAHAINFYYGITVWTAIFTIILKVLESKEKIKRDKLNQAIKIVNDFDNPHLRKARDFTRLFKKEHDENNLKQGELAKFIENELDENTKNAYMQKYHINSDNDIRALKSSLVYLFNYFQSVYAIIMADMTNKEYVLKALSNVYTKLFDRFKVWIERCCESGDKEQIKDLKNLKEMAEKYLKSLNKDNK